MSACRSLSRPDPSRVEPIADSRAGRAVYKFYILRSQNEDGRAVEIARLWKGTPDARIRIHSTAFVPMLLAIEEVRAGREIVLTAGKVWIRTTCDGALLFSIRRHNRFRLMGQRITLLAEAISAALEAAEREET